MHCRADEGLAFSHPASFIAPHPHAKQVEVGPHLTRLETEWVGAVKKNLEIEGHCMRLENECAALQKQVAARDGQ